MEWWIDHTDHVFHLPCSTCCSCVMLPVFVCLCVCLSVWLPVYVRCLCFCNCVFVFRVADYSSGDRWSASVSHHYRGDCRVGAKTTCNSTLPTSANALVLLFSLTGLLRAFCLHVMGRWFVMLILLCTLFYFIFYRLLTHVWILTIILIQLEVYIYT